MGDSKPQKTPPPTMEEKIQLAEARSRFRMMETALKGAFHFSIASVVGICLLMALIIMIDALRSGANPSAQSILQDMKDWLMTSAAVFKIAFQ